MQIVPWNFYTHIWHFMPKRVTTKISAVVGYYVMLASLLFHMGWVLK